MMSTSIVFLGSSDKFKSQLGLISLQVSDKEAINLLIADSTDDDTKLGQYTYSLCSGVLHFPPSYIQIDLRC